MFVDVLEKLLREKGVTAAKMLSDLGMNKSSVLNWKTRGTVPSGATLQRIADYFGVSVDYLLGQPETKKSPHLSEDLQKALEDSRANMAVVIGKGEERRVIEVPADAEEIIRAALEAFRDKK